MNIIEPLRPGVRFRVEVEGKTSVITGRSADMRRSFDLSSLCYIESDGMIQASIYDPLPFAGRVAANAAVRVMRG